MGTELVLYVDYNDERDSVSDAERTRITKNAFPRAILALAVRIAPALIIGWLVISIVLFLTNIGEHGTFRVMLFSFVAAFFLTLAMAKRKTDGSSLHSRVLEKLNREAITCPHCNSIVEISKPWVCENCSHENKGQAGQNVLATGCTAAFCTDRKQSALQCPSCANPIVINRKKYDLRRRPVFARFATDRNKPKPKPSTYVPSSLKTGGRYEGM